MDVTLSCKWLSEAGVGPSQEEGGFGGTAAYQGEWARSGTLLWEFLFLPCFPAALSPWPSLLLWVAPPGLCLPLSLNLEFSELRLQSPHG
jgi:hypothetical protein